MSSGIRFTQHLLISTLAFFLFSGCGNWAGNPKKPEEGGDNGSKTNVTLEIRGKDEGSSLLASSVPAYDTGGALLGNLSLTQARLSLRKIKLLAQGDGEGGDEEFKGPYIVNLLTDQVTPSISTLSIPAGSYNQVKLQLAKLEEDEAEGLVSSSDPLIRNSIHLVGTYQGLSESKPFEMTFDLDEEFFIGLSSSQTGNVDLEEGATETVVIQFDLTSWFDFSGENYDFSHITTSEINLEKDSEDPDKKIRESIKDNIKDSAEFLKEDQ